LQNALKEKMMGKGGGLMGGGNNKALRQLGAAGVTESGDTEKGSQGKLENTNREISNLVTATLPPIGQK
jgi:hypothetical protein